MRLQAASKYNKGRMPRLPWCLFPFFSYCVNGFPDCAKQTIYVPVILHYPNKQALRI